MKKHLISIALVGALTSASLHAEIHFSGFASVVGGMTTSSDESLYGYSDNIDFKEGSLFALQASSDLGNGLGATVQLEAKGKDDWQPDFKWAYLSYDASDSVRLLAGRQRLPFYMYSDYLDVSYAYAWIAPPTGVYDVPFDTFDGLGAVYTTNFGRVDASFHGVLGRNTDELTAFNTTFTPELNNVMGLSATFTYDWLTLRGGYFSADVVMSISDLDALAAGWEQAGFSDIAANTKIDEDKGTFVEVGFQINYESIIVVGEYTQLEVENTPLAVEDSYYIMAGYQFDQVLVHLTYGVDEGKTDNYTSDVSYGLDPTLDYLKQNTETALANDIQDNTYITAGVRYDFHDSAALKVEYTDYSDKNNSSGDAGLFRVAVVTVF
ncbi:porin [Colwellia sp. E2M01]|uniref:porin n=1 Tax=Colwellia sp. E2M01 TaxID=2841561 RepID=UPI001C08336B|nr:porin [Colwellia sp. E2M01]MBU2871999.1 porin [Colwellia sp. E2M01]